MLKNTQPLVSLTNPRWVGIIASFVEVAQMK
ncbi:hypothetical protein A2U01_0093494, partial [Trifolium medium]|nr:hypothetical protein [Trifolium medium]